MRRQYRARAGERSWAAVWSLEDDAGNVVQGEGEILLAGTSDSYAYVNHGCVAVIGLDNVVGGGDRERRAGYSKAHVDSVKDIVAQLKVERMRSTTIESIVHGAGMRRSIAATGTRSSASW